MVAGLSQGEGGFQPPLGIVREFGALLENAAVPERREPELAPIEMEVSDRGGGPREVQEGSAAPMPGPDGMRAVLGEFFAAFPDMHVDVQAARALVEAVAARKAAGERFTIEASTAKLFATEAAVRSADRAVQVHGGYGYIDEYPVQRLLRDARVTTLYEGTSQIQKLIIGRAATGINAMT